jgi:hypothetical protein
LRNRGAVAVGCLNRAMSPDDPVAVLQRWRDFGADFRVLHLSEGAAIVELCACTGEPVDRLESSDPRLLDYLRAAERRDG